MELAYVFGTKETSASILGFRGEEDSIFPWLKDNGYTAIEPFVRNPNLFNQVEFEKKVEKSGLKIAAIGTGPMVSDDKLTFTDKDPAVRVEAVKRVNEIIDFASIFQVPVNIGKVRGDIHEELFIQSWQWISKALNEVCEHADKVGVDIILEPQNKHNINNLNTTYETMNLIKELKLPNLKMMIDVFHLAFEDYSIEKSLSLVKDQLLHVHLADSNRFAPGMGDFDFTYTIQLLEDINYQGYLSLEVAAEKNRYKEAKDAAEFLYSIIHG